MANEATKLTINGVQHDVMDVGARQLIASVQAALNAITSGDTTTAIKTFQEVINFLDGVTDNETLAGKLNELRTLINGKYAKPANGIPSSDLAQSVQDILSDVANKVDKVNGKGLSTNDFTTALLEKLNALPDAEQYEEDIADAGKVKTVSVNNGTPATPDQNGNVNINVQSGAQGNDGITPHIDALTGNWFIGETDTHVKAQGEQGNSGVSSADEVAVVNNLDGEPDDLESGQVAVLSAGMGKFIGDRCIPLSGTFADAYDKAKVLNAVFPWMLIDEDENGNPVKKMMWHVGNRKFIDAIGAEIIGKKNGLTIISDEARTITLSFTGGSVTLPIDVGETNYSFNEIKELANVSGYNGDWFSGISFSGDTQPQLDIDFGGMTLKWSSSTRNFFPAYSVGSADTLSDYLFNYIKRLRLDVSGYLDMYPMISLKEVEMYGTWSYKDFRMLYGKISKTFITEKADLKGLIVTNAVTSISLLDSEQNNNSLQYLDIRGFDTSNVTSLLVARKCYALNTLIIGGGFSNEKVTSLGSGASLVAANTTIVCTSQTPPVLKNAVLSDGAYVHSGMDWVYYRVKSNGRILVPPGCADVYKNNVYIEPVDGEDVTITTDGKTTKTGWAMYADIIEEYNEGDY